MILLEQQAQLSPRDVKQHLPFYFDLPEGATKLEIHFSYDPVFFDDKHPNNEISLSLFDSSGARGARHNNRSLDIILTQHKATPGYTPGKLEPGRWCLLIDTHRILSEVSYKLEIHCSHEAVADEPKIWQKKQPKARGSGWYRGDLHGHTLHSDARWDVPDLIAYAKDFGLDFVTLSDHNTVSGLAEFHSFASDDLLTIGALELTTFHGHALALGTENWLEWRVKPHDKEAQTMQDIARAVSDAGATFVIAHPKSPGDPWCSGCQWSYAEMMPGIAKRVEVWNGGWEGDSNNEASLALYYQWLNQGHKLVATAGTDIHGPPKPNANLGFNVVYVKEFSQAAILEGVRQGTLYLSSEPELQVNLESSETIMGQTLKGSSAPIKVQWTKCQEDDRLRLMGNGEILQEQYCQSEGQATYKLEQAGWYTLEIRSREGYLRALSNPVFLDHA